MFEPATFRHLIWICFASLLLAFLLPAGARWDSPGEPFEREVYAMGTMLRISLYEPDRDLALTQTEQLIRVVEETEQQLSNWRIDTELSLLNRHPVGKPFQTSPSFWSVLNVVSEWVRRTNRAFDPAIGQLLEVWQIQQEGRIAGISEIDTALHDSGIRYLRLKPGEVVKERPVLLDAGAFGKGEALDRALALAKKEKMEPLLLDFGGQIAVHGLPPRADHWETDLADPGNQVSKSGNTIRFRYGSLATSGGSERDLDVNGKRIGHILDPRTGKPITAFGSVTVWHGEALVADILSTALYVMGPEEGPRWATANGVAACFLISKAAEQPRTIFTLSWQGIK